MILAYTSQPVPPGTRHATNHDARIVALQVIVVLMAYQVSQCYHHLMLSIARLCVCPWTVRSQQKSRMTEHK
jgi:hypothetical protein